MEEKKEFKLFREKSLETMETPESLNDYLRVTSPGVWVVLAAIIALLVGAILWSILGRINTVGTFAVEVSEEKCVCYVSFDEIDQVMEQGIVTVNGKDYALVTDAECEMDIISEDTNPYVLRAGKLEIGDLAIQVPVLADLPNGIYAGSIITEKLQPFSLLLN